MAVIGIPNKKKAATAALETMFWRCYSSQALIRTAIMRMIINNRMGIQIGDNTHHHDHAITLVSLRPTKRTVSNPVKPMPPEEEEEEALMI
jgi:hypothetical protein